MTDWQALEKQVFMTTGGRRLKITAVRGEGVHLWDEAGRRYLDFVAGWAAVSLGHCHPVVVQALQEQGSRLIHASNEFYTVPQVQLALLLTEHSCLDRVFFANSGAEANEGAVKLARKYGRVHLDGAYEVISTWHSFHGRTLAMVAASGKPEYQETYVPLPEGFRNVDYDDIEAIQNATNANTCAVLLEPVQGEGGVNVPSPDYLKQVRQWCDEKGLLLIFDEIQTGIGRLGTLFGYQHFGVEPDIMTLAKGLGSGVPIGALLCKERANAFTVGDHGTTFGGNPLVTAVSHAVLTYVIENDVPANARARGAELQEGLSRLQDKYPFVVDVRGLGLLQAIEFDREIALAVATDCLEHGLLLNPVKPTALRFMPPLIVTTEDVEEAVSVLDGALERAAEGTG